MNPLKAIVQSWPEAFNWVFHRPDASEDEIRIIAFAGNATHPTENGPYYVISIRDHILYGADDLVGDPRMQIVEKTKPLAERIAAAMNGPNVTAFYLQINERGEFSINTICQINFNRLRTALTNAVESKATQTPAALLANWCEYYRKFQPQPACQKILEGLYLLPYITIPLPEKLEF